MRLLEQNQFNYSGAVDLLFLGTDRTLSSQSAFIFTMKNAEGLGPLKFNIRDNKQNKAAETRQSEGPIFGAGDIRVKSNANVQASSFTDLGQVYDISNTPYSPGSQQAKNLLAGSFYFIPDNIEVFKYSSKCKKYLVC